MKIQVENLTQYGMTKAVRKILETIYKIHISTRTEKLPLKNNENFSRFNHQNIVNINRKGWPFAVVKEKLNSYVKAGFFKRFIKCEKINDKRMYKIFIYPTQIFYDLALDSNELKEKQQEEKRRTYIALQIFKLLENGMDNAAISKKLNSDGLKPLKYERWTTLRIKSFIADNEAF